MVTSSPKEKKQSNQAAPNQSSQSRPATYEAAAAKIKAEMLPILKNANNNKLDLKKINNGYTGTIYTVHQNLTYIINKSNDKPFTKRQDNYMKYIKEFDYELDILRVKRMVYQISYLLNMIISNWMNHFLIKSRKKKAILNGC
ncbi:hypothetical protein ACTFIZ_007561 [Dictyostelium cf. discoideum]